MLLLQFEYQVHTPNVLVSDKAKASWLVSPLVLQDHAVFNGSKVQEVVPKCLQLKVVGQAADKDLSELSINLVSIRQGLLPYARQGLQLFFIVCDLLFG